MNAKPISIDPIIIEWRTWQYARGLSKRTVTERVATIARMASWCGKNALSVTTSDIVLWLAEGGEEWSRNTRWTYYTTLTSWFAWLQRLGHRTDNPMAVIDSPRRSRGEPHPVSNIDMQRLLTVRAHKRTRAMILLAAFQGLRAHEIAQVRGDHIDLVDRRITVTGKGDFTATLPVHSRVIEIAYQMPSKGPWFPGPVNGCQRRESICGTLKESMVRAGVPGSAHSLRHWFGTALVEAGVDLRVVQTLLRHQSLATTQVYTLASERRRADGIELLDPFRMDQLAA